MNNILTVIDPCGDTDSRGMNNYKSAERYHGEGDYEKWFQINLISANEGYAPCQNNVGYAYDLGVGVHQNQAEAVRWYKLAADQNHPEAQFNLAYCYFNGTGIQQSEQEGMKYLLHAANNNHPVALFNVGCRLDDQGDNRRAIEYYIKSAEMGYPAAQYNIGLCYIHGDGVPNDSNKGTYWIIQAAKNGLDDAINLLRQNNISF